VEKAPDAFRTISEVAIDLNVPQHVLRFWESRFSEIKPMKRGGGRRYYRPDDVDLLRGIRHLLYGEGYTIRGVQRILKEQGLRYVQTVWQPGAQSVAQASEHAAEDSDFDESDSRGAGGERGRGLFGLLPSLIGNAGEEQQDKAAEEDEDVEEAEEDEDAEEDDDAEDVEEEEDDDSDEEEEEDEDDDDADDEDEDEEDDEEDAAPARVTSRPLPLQRKPPLLAGGALRAAVSTEDMRKLEFALRELSECRRLLDAAVKEKV
jgi:DNA-binding transcriptional MerR regulator